jgi:SAM-dependent methyltransferase
MAYGNEWEKLYAAGEQQSLWPWSSVVSHVFRYTKPNGPDFRVLELGCGPGANVPFFRSLDVDYRAIDGSESAVNTVLERFPELADKIAVADFTDDIPFEGPFDLIIERAALAHNDTHSIRQCLRLIEGKLSPKGVFIGLDWFATSHSEFPGGRDGSDRFTRTGFGEESLNFANVGTVHFSDRDHLEDLFADFKIESLHLNKKEQVYPGNDHILATWNIVAAKP